MPAACVLRKDWGHVRVVAEEIKIPKWPLPSYFSLRGKWNSSGCALRPLTPEGKFKYVFFSGIGKLIIWGNCWVSTWTPQRYGASHWSLNLLSTSSRYLGNTQTGPRHPTFENLMSFTISVLLRLFFFSVNTFLEKPLIGPGNEDELCAHDVFSCALVLATWCQRCERQIFTDENTHTR